MFKLHRKASCAVHVVAAVAVLMETALAQIGPAVNPEPFVELHAALMGAADKALADVLADRPWMKTPNPDSDAEPQRNLDRVQRLGAAVQRVQQLRPLVEPIFRAQGVPPELIALALVESGGQALALSPQGARGVWQFMPDTARRYGLTVAGERDDRIEILKSTRAAARYLRDLHQQFGDWQVALAAYNAGEQAVQRAIDRSGRQVYPAIARFLPVETRNYVPAVLDAMRLFGEGVRLQQVRRGEPARESVWYAHAQLTE